MNTPIARRRRPSAGRDNIQEISRRLTVGGRSGDVPKHRQPNVPHVELAMFAVTAMLVCYALEDRSPWWPFGLVEAVWALVAARRWWYVRHVAR